MRRYDGVKKSNFLIENILSLILFLPSLYFGIANTLISFIPLYIFTFALGGFSYLILLIKSPTKFFFIVGSFVLTITYSISLNANLYSFILSTSSLEKFASSRLTFLIFLYFPIFLLSITKKLNYKFLILKMYKFSLLMLPILLVANFQRLI